MEADLEAFTDSVRSRMAASIWQLAQDRKPGTVKLRVFNPSPATSGWSVDHTVLEVINDDMPFLIDSMSGALQRLGLTLHLIIHPVFQVSRSADGKLVNILGDKEKNKPAAAPGVGIVLAESMVHIEMDHCLDESQLALIEKELRSVLADVRAAVEDWPIMRERMAAAIEDASTARHQEFAAANNEEAKAFMRWLDSNNFTYLGYRDIDLVQEGGKLTSIKVLPKSGLGVLRDNEIRMFGGLRDMGAKQSPQLQSYVQQHKLLVVTKTNQPSRVHRPVPMDAIFVRRFDAEGNIIGERLFVGLFTSQSYSQNPREIPFLRHKINHVLAHTDFRASGHAYKMLVHILNNYPHDELFQISEDDLLKNSLGILQLQERGRVALFMRVDPFERFITCLIYVPRDRYDSALRNRFEKYLESAFEGKAGDWDVRIDDSPLARAFVTILVKPHSPRPAHEVLETNLRELSRGWSDRLRDQLVTEYGEAMALAVLRRYRDAFPLAYCDVVTPLIAVHDIQNIERTRTAANRLVVDLSQNEKTGELHLKLFQPEQPIVLSDVLPLIENMGLKIEYMGGPYEVRPKDSDTGVFIHEFVGRSARAPVTDFGHIQSAFVEAFGEVWSGNVENDGFNALGLRTGMAWNEIRVLRAFARYLRQLRIPYSNEIIAATLLNHPNLARQLYALFFARHNPDLKGNRVNICRDIETQINESLAKVSTLEEDRIIRRYVNLIQASLRTNNFQLDVNGAIKPYLSIKFDSRAVEFMPLPKPLFEIFVYSPRVEAVHLRGGKVARGGIRWSDRREDFRNEILGLMKAQMVKNSVIVPLGSKGGFIVKRPPAEADKFMAEGIACYRTMMCGLLDITDNRVGNKIVPPANVVRYDNDDPYLVVAADKGTAKFSDIANGISQEYGFWLDDAFASGGSAGYDHKGMGITARGAWEAVKRHFRELGKDIQTSDFTCIGVGDMSGDVFGNGMLLSKHTLMLGAFDHRHIFCDPTPDPAVSFVERERMFNLPRSSWADYDVKKISKGGGIFARSEKTIKISPEMKKAYDLTADTLSPTDLMQAMLKADVELLYFGGIGTYVKATSETHEEAGDRANDAIRIDGVDIRAKVVGEGANLGMTQNGRVEYALKGGKLNTDAIDNSAGVDTSDHEVNIKILLRKLTGKNGMSIEARNKFLASMTNDVGAHVLLDNYYQTQALSVAESRSIELLPQHERCMQLLEKSGLLNRAVEFLPDTVAIAERRREGKGLTRPELAVLMAYAKIWLYDQLLASNLPDDDYLQNDLARYFPEALQKKYPDEIQQHQLRRELIATIVTNSIINRTGIHLVLTMADRTGKDAATITRAYLLAREVFDLRTAWSAIEALDNKIPATVQTQMLLAVNETLAHAIQWFTTEITSLAKLSPVIEAYRKGVQNLAAWLISHAEEIDGGHKKQEAVLTTQGVPARLAQAISMMPLLGTALDLTRLAEKSPGGAASIADVFFGLSRRLGLDWLADRARSFAPETPWQREAIGNLLDELATIHRQLTALVLNKNRDKTSQPGKRLGEWLEKHASSLERYDAQLNEWRTTGTIDIAMLTLAVRRLGGLAY
jgi:glutamate dehydrogenase